MLNYPNNLLQCLFQNSEDYYKTRECDVSYALDKYLPLNQARVLILRYRENLSIASIAKIYQVSSSTIYSWRKKAFERLRCLDAILTILNIDLRFCNYENVEPRYDIMEMDLPFPAKSSMIEKLGSRNIKACASLTVDEIKSLDGMGLSTFVKVIQTMFDLGISAKTKSRPDGATS